MKATSAEGSTNRLPTAERARYHWLDGVRGASAIFVVLHHVWLFAYPAFPRNTGPWWLGWALYGHLAVAVFIVVSGFSLGLRPVRRDLILPEGPRNFLRRRAWRILPPYYASLVISSLLVLLVIGPRTGAFVDARTFLVYGSLLQDVLPAHIPNGVFWSIAVEWQIYFLFPLLLLCARAWGLRVAVGAAVLVVLAAHATARVVPGAYRLDHLTPQFLALFALGVLAARATVRAARGPQALLLAAGALLGASGLVALCALQGPVFVTSHYFWVDLWVGATVAATMGLLTSGGAGPLRRCLSVRPMRAMGTISYSIYLLHGPLVEVTWLYVVEPRNLSPLERYFTLLASVPVVVAACTIFFVMFERPFLHPRSLARLSRPRRSRDLARPATQGLPTPVTATAASETDPKRSDITLMETR